MSQIVIGTAGHIDHGKTSLVRALTGTDTDSLLEEKKRGMTIDIGFAYLNKNITIIDVPGHEKFIRNMTAGASGIHFALIIIAADDGIMPQTREHIDILISLGINRGWVVITKIDIVQDQEWVDLIEMDIETYLSKCGFHSFSNHRINNLNGEGVDGLLNSIKSEISPIKSIDSKKYFRMNIDRFFSKKGFGTVVTGTVIQGNITPGALVEISPGNLITKVRSIHSHGQEVEIANPGDRAAINLASTKINAIRRGTVLLTPNTITPTNKILAEVKMVNSTKWCLKNNQRVRIHFGTSQVLGRALIKDKKEYRKGENGKVIFMLESKISASMDDRFVIRTYSPLETIAGGKILDTGIIAKLNDMYNLLNQIPIEPRKRFLFFVDTMWEFPRKINHWEKIFLNYNNNILKWCKKFKIKISPKGFAITEKNIEKGKIVLTEFFKNFHRDNPFKRLISFETLQSFTKWEHDFLEMVLNNMLSANLITEINRSYHLIEISNLGLSKSQLMQIKTIENIILSSGLTPILFSEIANISKQKPKTLQDLINTLVYDGNIIEIGKSFYLHKEKFLVILNYLRRHFNISKEINVNSFKQLTGLTRKTAIPLLEYLDDKHYTNRKENLRFVGDELYE